jgi:hypothetical protein
MVLLPTVYVDNRDWVLTLTGLRPYPKVARDLMGMAEANGWWIMDGLPTRIAPDGFTHRIRVEVGRKPVRGRHGYRYMALWTSDAGEFSQFSVSKILGMSTEWNGWISIPGITDIMSKIGNNPLNTVPALPGPCGAGTGQIEEVA